MSAKARWIVVIVAGLLVLTASLIATSRDHDPVAQPTTTQPTVGMNPGTTPTPSTPSSAEPTGDGDGDDEGHDHTSGAEGENEGGEFDPDNPPPGAPSSTEIRAAMDNSAGFWTEIGSYGYPDEHMNDFIHRALPYMTDGLATEWRHVDAHTKNEPDPVWIRLTEEETRHITIVDEVLITDGSSKSRLGITLLYRSGDVRHGDDLPSAATPQEVEITVAKDENRWRVASAKRTVHP